MREWAGRLRDQADPIDVIVHLVTHALHPGVLGTKLLQRTGFANQPTVSPDAGAQTSVFLATDPSAAETSGRYWVRCRQQRAKAVHPDVARRLWALSLRQCGLQEEAV